MNWVFAILAILAILALLGLAVVCGALIGWLHARSQSELEKFNKAVREMQVAIGKDLLPVYERTLAQAIEWLSGKPAK